MRIRNFLAALTCTAGLAASGMAAQTPISLTASSFNYNLIFGSSTPVTASMDGGVIADAGPNQTYYVLGRNGDSSGVPLGGSITSDSDPTTTYQFQLDGGNNGALVHFNQVASQTLTLTSPGAYKTLSFLGDGGADVVHYTLNFVGGTTATAPLVMPGWFSGQQTDIAFNAGGRTASNSFSPNQIGATNGNIMYENNIDVPLADQGLELSSITLTVTDSTNTNGPATVVFALSGDAVPEPATAAILGIGSVLLMARRRHA